ncbi:hypothetical protein ACODUI_11665 [Stenotrophomonas geniculata]
MSNDNKTLADVKPGGMVRLGDQPKRARFEAWHCEKFKTRWLTGAPTRDMHNGAYAEKYGPADQQARWELWQAAWESALSAQPSPGGQDALAVIEELAELNRACAALDPDYKGPTEAAVQTALAALAARQPVGEPVAWMTHHDEPMLLPTAAEAADYCEDDEQPVPLFRSPAQAVDLGKFRDVVVDWRDRCCQAADKNTILNMAKADKLLALIDSQAVGDGR